MTIRPIARVLAEFRDLTETEVGAVSGGDEMIVDGGGSTICATNEITRRDMNPPDEGTTLDAQ